MSNYNILINILDKLRCEAPESYKSYRPDQTDLIKINQARAKAYIHLFLKADLGVIDFIEREKFVTDGTNDGGIDGYYIDYENKKIYFIQSKFRTTENNFEQKEIKVDELLKMDIERMLDGEITHENGIPYNEKIKLMLNELRSINDIARYKYEVIILANLSSISDGKIKLLTSGLPFKIYDFKRAFSELVFPIISGTYYNYSDIYIKIDLTNKSSGANINYSVETSLGMSDITVLFAPLSEIGEIMYKYKNSILKYNPRSYLTLKEGTINDGIKQTILSRDSNEFALFNNGITILSDETFFNQRIGQKDKAQLSLKNPQIINGGQTAYTLSLIYEDSLSDNSLKEKLEKKEVLVKIITFSLNEDTPNSKKLELIESISEATNKQNQVNNADRNSNNPLLIASQKALFIDFGFLLERKRGEFFDGIRYGYISRSQIIDRGIFMRIAFSCLGYPVPPKKERQLLTEEKIESVLKDVTKFRKYFFGCLLYSELKTKPNQNEISQFLSSGYYAIIAICAEKYFDEKYTDIELKALAKDSVNKIIIDWPEFENYVSKQFHNSAYIKYNFNYYNKTYNRTYRLTKYYRSKYVAVDINDFFFDGKVKLEEDSVIREDKLTLEKHLAKFDLNIGIIEKIKPLIDPSNWYDNYTLREISMRLSLNIRTVRAAIKIITSKELGFYVLNDEDLG